MNMPRITKKFVKNLNDVELTQFISGYLSQAAQARSVNLPSEADRCSRWASVAMAERDRRLAYDRNHFAKPSDGLVGK